VNAIHDPFIHKLPPEIGSHIFRLCLPTLYFEDIDFDLWTEAETSALVLRLGAVSRKWCQLAWATPDLWDTLYLMIHPSMKRSLAESLPGLLREWLSRSGMRPLTIFFLHFGCSEEGDYSPPYNDPSRESTVKALEFATDLVIEVINSHWSRWRNFHLNVDAVADIPKRLCGSLLQPNQIFRLELQVTGETSPTQKFVMKTKPFPTQLTLHNLSPTSIDIGWDNITCADLSDVSTSECLELLRRAPALEYYLVEPSDDPTVNVDTPILHPRLHSLHYTSSATKFLEAINVPSLEEWTLYLSCETLPPVTTMVSLLECSGCYLKILTLEEVPHSTNLCILLQAVPSIRKNPNC
jgi:hypothetical protein